MIKDSKKSMINLITIKTILLLITAREFQPFFFVTTEELFKGVVTLDELTFDPV